MSRTLCAAQARRWGTQVPCLSIAYSSLPGSSWARAVLESPPLSRLSLHHTTRYLPNHHCFPPPPSLLHHTHRPSLDRLLPSPSLISLIRPPSPSSSSAPDDSTSRVRPYAASEASPSPLALFVAVPPAFISQPTRLLPSVHPLSSRASGTNLDSVSLSLYPHFFLDSTHPQTAFHRCLTN